MNVNDPIVIVIVGLVGGFLVWQMQRVMAKVDEMMTNQATARERERTTDERITRVETSVGVVHGRLDGILIAIGASAGRHAAEDVEHGKRHTDPP